MTGFGKDGKGTILYHTDSLSLTALAAGEAAAGTSYSLSEDFRILKMDIYGYIEGLAAGDAVDGVLCGLADGELTSAEISECLVSEPSDANDHIPLERSHRPVWPLGMATPSGAHADGIIRYLNGNGQAQWIKRWTFGDAEAWKFWCYNMGSTALSSGATFRFLAKIYGVWVR